MDFSSVKLKNTYAIWHILIKYGYAIKHIITIFQPGWLNMKKILVVDDEADITELVSALLEKQGYDVKTFNMAKEALKYIEDVEEPDIVLARKERPVFHQDKVAAQL